MQFLVHYKRVQGMETSSFVWGDEIEYGVFGRSARGHLDLSLRASDLIARLVATEPPVNASGRAWVSGCDWQPEYGSWMVEAVPKLP